MAAVIAVLGQGPHGTEIADQLRRWGHEVVTFDDALGDAVEAAGSLDYIAGAAWPAVRRQIAGKARGKPHANGNIAFPGAQWSRSAEWGCHVHLGYNTVVSHGCRMGDFVTVCAGAVIAGEVEVGDDVFIGAGATVIHGGIKIGPGAVIGAGAVVTRDVPAGLTVVGVPARGLRSRSEPPPYSPDRDLIGYIEEGQRRR